MYTEVEVKFIVEDRDGFLARLTDCDATLIERRFEHNIRFDTPTDTLRLTDRVLRLRRIETDDVVRHIVTIKTPVTQPSPETHRNIRRRREAEFIVDNPEAFVQGVGYLGYIVSWRYEKYRSVYQMDEVEVTLDDTPLGTIVEIEGDSRAIGQAAKALGFDMADGSTLSYSELFDGVVNRLKLNVEDLTFDAFEDIEVPINVLKGIIQ